MNGNLDLFNHPATLAPIPLPDAEVYFMPGFYTGPHSDRLKQALLRETQWRQETIRLWGKEHLQPRLSAWHGDAGNSYTYSGITLAPQPWTATLLQIKGNIERVSGYRFNSVLLNLYRNELDGVGWHSDDEKELGDRPVIASLSLGETRTFKLRHKTRKERKPLALELTDGSLLLMAGTTQQFWRHAIEKERAAKSERINLTFRAIRSAR